MNVFVCCKQVPNTNDVKIDPDKGTLIRDKVDSILNPDDACALELALRLKDEYDEVFVTVISMGPTQADEMLRECLAMGADRAVLLSDRAFGGADTWATSNTLAAALTKLDGERKIDIIFAGRQAIDGDTAQVGPQIAEKLDLPQVTYVQEIELHGDFVRVRRQLADGHEIVEVKLPALLTVVKYLEKPRYMSVDGIYEAYEKEITVWGFNDLPVEESKIGLKSSPTRVVKSFAPERPGKGLVFSGPVRNQVSRLIEEFSSNHILR